MSRADFKAYSMELIIVIVGITAAFQLQIYNEKRISRQIEINSLSNLKMEIEINIEEFESLKEYRSDITQHSIALLEALKNGPITSEFASEHVFKLVRTSTPDLQNQATQAYLESNWSYTNIELKNELLLLQTQLQELQGLSSGYQDRKQSKFMDFLFDEVDFPAFKIISMKAINSITFKNIIWNQTSDEYELNRLYDLASAQLHKVDSLLTVSLE